MKNINMIAVVLLIAGLGAGFFAGMKYQQSQNSSFVNFRQGQFDRQNRNMMGRGAIMGQIISQDDKSITVKLQDNSSKIVLLSASATISKTDVGSKTDLKTGANVAVFGITNSDGSVTAQNVQLNPMFRAVGQGTQSGVPR